jgi:CBS domain-containing protein
MSEPTNAAPSSPSSSLLGNLRQELARAVPFSQMQTEHLNLLLAGAAQAYFAPGEVVLEPASGPCQTLLCIRQGSVTGRKGLADSAGQFEYEVGDLFPVGALMATRAVTATYTANEDTFCLCLPAAQVQRVAALSPSFADFLNRRVMHILALSKQAMQTHFAAQALAEHSMEKALGQLPVKEPLTCSADTPLREALGRMHTRRVGSVLVVDPDGALQGILTRHDILGRITLPQLPLDTAIGQVMSTPVASLNTEHTLQDAALLMSQGGIRQIPVLSDGRVVNVVSQRDLFGLQRLSLKNLGSGIRAAADVATLKGLAADIRDFARNLLGQGVQARQLTELISHLNDLLTTRLVQLMAAQHRVDLSRACWLTFGSEGRGEQTVATDQDNGLVFASENPDLDRPAWLAFAADVNQALDSCGYPLCKGGVMAGNPACCLITAEWATRFTQWVERGGPEDLLRASIYFDLRPLCGNPELAAPLQTLVRSEPARVPRFIKQMSDNALRHGPPLNWRGALATQDVQGQAVLDLKLQGTALFVDAARLYALAHGLPALSTRDRLLAAAPVLGVAAAEAEAWVAGFEFLQMLRLQVQLGGRAAVGQDTGGPGDANPNAIDTGKLNDIDRRMLKEAMRMARSLQQRMQLDYSR